MGGVDFSIEEVLSTEAAGLMMRDTLKPSEHSLYTNSSMRLCLIVLLFGIINVTIMVTSQEAIAVHSTSRSKKSSPINKLLAKYDVRSISNRWNR
jgi:hypothetical protein